MTEPVSGICLFCESVRPETHGGTSLVGVLNDHLIAPSIPNTLSNLALYVRLYVATDFDPNPLTITIDLPEGETSLVTTLDPDLINQARATARAIGDPVAGFVTHSSFAPFVLQNSGVMKVRAAYSSGECLLGFLRFLGPNSPDLPSPSQSSARTTPTSAAPFPTSPDRS